MIKVLAKRLALLPDELQGPVKNIIEDASLQQSNTLKSLEDNAVFLDSVVSVLACSQFVSKTYLISPQLIVDLFLSGDMTCTYRQMDFENKFKALLVSVQDEASLMRALRQFRLREMTRIAWRDLASLSSLEETLEDLSTLADICIHETVKALYEFLMPLLGTPVDSEGIRQSLLVLALGKLGGRELNFSSDVDLILCYDKKGETIDNPRPVENEIFFTRLAQSVVKVLSEIEIDGFVYRVDLRLRPFGDTGPLVLHYKAMEIYYQEHGREWERYALIKARLISGDAGALKLQKMLDKFVYRRYVDYGVIDALRDLKQIIDRETRQKSLENNIKRGAGGIREIEFIVQAIQLIRGGKEPYLRNNSLLASLSLLEKHQCLTKNVITELRQAYKFLRDLENRLQMYDDKQTQQLPDDEIGQIRITQAMGYNHWEAFHNQLLIHRKNVRNHFNDMIADPYIKQKKSAISENIVNDIKTIWLGDVDLERVNQIFAKINYLEDINPLLVSLSKFRQSHRVKSISSIAKNRLNSLMPFVLLEVTHCQNSVVTLERVISVLESIVKRSAYLSLLLENPQTLKSFIQFCSSSALITKLIARFPLLLDELLTDSSSIFQGFDELASELKLRLLSIPEENYEEQIECLHQFKQTCILKVAASDVMGLQPLMRVSDCLTNIAAAILWQAQRIIWNGMVRQYGYPTGPSGRHNEEQFVVVAYGKLGGLELGYSSDLDLVFLYSGDSHYQTDGPKPLPVSEFYLKFGQRMVHLLSMQTVSGSLYEVDMQLRPSGSAGLLVTNIDGFSEYQKTHAWTWEHQALVRARPMTGPKALWEQFQQIRYATLTGQRDEEELKNQIVDMRKKMRARDSGKVKSGFDIKQGYGGVTDIEFMVQYLVLLMANKHPLLTQYTDNIRLLESLRDQSLLAEKDCNLLIEAYKAYRADIHRTALQDESAVVSEEMLLPYREDVCDIWNRLFSGEY